MVAIRPVRALAILGIAVSVAVVLHASVGSYVNFDPLATLHEVLRGPQRVPDASNNIVWQLRLPRALLCLLVGAILGAVGSAFQALFRNSLADPYIVGVSSGAAVGGCLVLVAGWASVAGGLGLALGGFATGMASLAVVYALSTRRGVVDVRTLLLAGVVTGSLMSALLSMVLLLAGKDTNDVLRWLMGNTSLASWPKAAVLFGALVLGSAILLPQTRQLNALALGGDTAHQLGVDVRRLTRLVLWVGSAMTAAAVGTVGVIGFLGLVAPHLSRRLIGVDWRFSLPGSMLTGALLLVMSDVIAQRGMSVLTHTPGMDLPVGIVTGVLGAPALLILLRKEL